MKKFIFQIHKVTGSVMSLLFLIWFISGIVLIFEGYPHASRKERFLHLNTFSARDFQHLITPSPSLKGKVELEKYGDKIVYRVYTGKKKQQVYDATTLQPIISFSAEQAKAIATSYRNQSIKEATVITHLDQWIPWSYYKALLPMYKFYMDDEAHSEIYVSQKTGSIVQHTTRTSRWFAYVGGIPHWVYFVSLRSKIGLWRTLMIILSSLGIVACISGMVVGLYRFRKKSVTPFKKFHYKWHHLTGFFFGIFAFTFILSGLVSVTNIPDWMVGVKHKEKIIWNQPLNMEPHQVFTPEDIWQSLIKKDGIRKIVWKTVFNTPHYFVYYDDYQMPEVYKVNNNKIIPAPLISEEHVVRQGELLWPKNKFCVVKQCGFDNYYQSSAMLYLPHTAYKIELNDQAKTWLYINPKTGEEIKRYTKSTRVRRWMYRFLHTFNVQVLKEYNGLRKALLVIVSLMGIAISFTGLVLSKKWFKQLLKRNNTV